ncbi:unnamed protein product [Boreogadus saida]
MLELCRSQDLTPAEGIGIKVAGIPGNMKPRRPLWLLPLRAPERPIRGSSSYPTNGSLDGAYRSPIVAGEQH